MRCCWVQAVSLLPVVQAGGESPACGSASCANPACPRRRAGLERAAGADELDEVLRALAVEGPEAEELTERIVARLHRDGPLTALLAGAGERE